MRVSYIAKLLIVEDEEPFMQDILMQIEACKLPYQIVGTVYSALDALALIAREQPDVMLSDIRMPGMDGLALAAKVHEQFPHIRCVLISGFMDFSYAKRACSLGVREYLIKPVEKNDLRDCLMQIYDELIGPLHRIQKSLLSNELNGVRQSDIKEHFSNTSFLFMHICAGNSYNLLQYRWISETYYSQLSRLDFGEILAQLLPDYRIWVVNQPELNKCFLFISTAHCTMEPSVLAEWLMTQLRSKCSQLPITIAYSNRAVQHEDIYEEAMAMRSVVQKHQEAWRSNCFASTLMPEHTSSYAALQTEEEQLFESLMAAGNITALRAQLRKQFDARCMQYLRQINLENYLGDVAAYFCYKSTLRPETIDAYDYEWLASKVAVSRSADECFDLFYDSLSSILNLSQSAQLSSLETLIRQVCEYIDQNFNKSINIENIAKQYYITSEHLIRTFKKHVGTTPLQYIINKRLESAKVLLLIEPPLDVRTIAQMVGYENPHYFSRIFKSSIGVTPSAYRQNLAGNE